MERLYSMLKPHMIAYEDAHHCKRVENGKQAMCVDPGAGVIERKSQDPLHEALYE